MNQTMNPKKIIAIVTLIITLFLLIFSNWIVVKGDFRENYTDGMDEVYAGITSAGDFGLGLYGESVGINTKKVGKMLNDAKAAAKAVKDGTFTIGNIRKVVNCGGKYGDSLTGLLAITGNESEEVTEAVDTFHTLRFIFNFFWFVTVIVLLGTIVCYVIDFRKINGIPVVCVSALWIIIGLIAVLKFNNFVEESVVRISVWPFITIVFAVVSMIMEMQYCHSYPAPAGVNFTNPFASLKGNQFQAGQMGFQGQTWTCPSCGKVLPEQTKFCAGCGTSKPVVETPKEPEQAVPTPKFCPGCGAPLNPGTKFCTKCGRKL